MTTVEATRDARLDGLLTAMRRFWAATGRRRGRESRLPDGLSVAQVRLAALLHAEGAMTGRQLADAAHCSAAATSEMLDHLERAGHVSRERSASDRRAQTVCLTESGRAIVERKLAEMREHAAGALADCSDDELAAAAKVLTRLAELLDAPAP